MNKAIIGLILILVLAVVLQGFGVIDIGGALMDREGNTNKCIQACEVEGMDFYNYQLGDIFTDEECRCKDTEGDIVEIY